MAKNHHYSFKRSEITPTRWFLCFTEDKQLRIKAYVEKTGAEDNLARLRDFIDNSDLKIIDSEGPEKNTYGFAFGLDFENEADEASFMLKVSD